MKFCQSCGTPQVLPDAQALEIKRRVSAAKKRRQVISLLMCDANHVFLFNNSLL